MEKIRIRDKHPVSATLLGSHLVWLEEELVLGAGEAGGGALRPHQLGPEQVGAALQLLAHLATETRHLRGNQVYRKHQSCIAVFRIHDNLVWIRIRGSMPLTNGSGSCYFRH
jgi:hypothetical protein